MPKISLCFPGFNLEPLSLDDKSLYIISLTSVDFPEPEIPVTQVIVWHGISTSIFFKLFSLAPITFKNSPLPFLLVLGIGINFSPFKYCPVIEFLQFFSFCS